MKYTKLLACLVLVACLAPVLCANAEAQTRRQVLVPGDVERFIKTFPAINGEYRKLGITYDPKTGVVTGMDQPRARREVRKILNANGWTMAFLPKMRVIIHGYAVERYGELRKPAEAKVVEKVKEIQDSKELDDETKEAVYKGVEQAAVMSDKLAADYRATLHPKDLEQIRPHLGALAKVLNDG